MTQPVPVFPAALLLALSALCLPAQAQSIYRCGESYSNTPCAGATVIAIDDARSAAQRSQSEAATRRDARLAEALEKDRLQLESRAAPAVILATAPIGKPALPAADKPAAKGKPKKLEQFSAVSPKKPGEAATPAKKKKRTETA
jgi:hypothetical protein